MNDNDQTAHEPPQPNEPEETPAQALGEYLDLIDKDVDERYTDELVDERLQKFLLQVAHDEVAGDTTTDTADADAEGQQDTTAEQAPEITARPVLDEFVDALLQPQHGTVADLESSRTARVNIARLEAEGILDAARRKAEQYQDAALTQAALTVRNAREEADRILVEARKEASRITQAAHAQASATAPNPPFAVTPVTPAMEEAQSAWRRIFETLENLNTEGQIQLLDRPVAPSRHGQCNVFPAGSFMKMTVILDTLPDDVDMLSYLQIERPEGRDFSQAERYLRRAFADPASCGTRMGTWAGAGRQRARAELLRLLDREYFVLGPSPEPGLGKLQYYLRRLGRHAAAEGTLQSTEILLTCLTRTTMLEGGLGERLMSHPAVQSALKAPLASIGLEGARTLLACLEDSIDDSERGLVAVTSPSVHMT